MAVNFVYVFWAVALIFVIVLGVISYRTFKNITLEEQRELRMSRLLRRRQHRPETPDFEHVSQRSGMGERTTGVKMQPEVQETGQPAAPVSEESPEVVVRKHRRAS